MTLLARGAADEDAFKVYRLASEAAATGVLRKALREVFARVCSPVYPVPRVFDELGRRLRPSPDHPDGSDAWEWSKAADSIQAARLAGKPVDDAILSAVQLNPELFVPHARDIGRRLLLAGKHMRLLRHWLPGLTIVTVPYLEACGRILAEIFGWLHPLPSSQGRDPKVLFNPSLGTAGRRSVGLLLLGCGKPAAALPLLGNATGIWSDAAGVSDEQTLAIMEAALATGEGSILREAWRTFGATTPSGTRPTALAPLDLDLGDAAALRLHARSLAGTTAPWNALLLARVHLGLGDAEGARAALRAVPEGGAVAAVLRARASLAAGEPAEASARLEEIDRQVPDWPEPRFRLGLALAGLRQEGKALEALEPVVLAANGGTDKLGPGRSGAQPAAELTGSRDGRNVRRAARPRAQLPRAGRCPQAAAFLAAAWGWTTGRQADRLSDGPGRCADLLLEGS